MQNHTEEVALIIAGSILAIGVIALLIFVYVRFCQKGARHGGEGTYETLLKPDATIPVYDGGTNSQLHWRYGELDDDGLRRVQKWLDDVLRERPLPLDDDVIIESPFLGQQDEIGEPPGGFSPRVSVVGSEDGNDRFRRATADRNYDDPLSR